MEAAIFVAGIMLIFIGYLTARSEYRIKLQKMEDEYTVYVLESYQMGHKKGHKSGWVSGVEMMERKISNAR